MSANTGSARCALCGTVAATNALFCMSCGGVIIADAARSPIDATPRAVADELQSRLEEVTRGEFQIVRELGRGGMARVFLARQLRLDRDVAIKVMQPEMLCHAGMTERFQREATTNAALRHPNIVAVYDARHDLGLHWFAMEYVRGCALDDVLELMRQRHERLPLPIVRHLLFQVASALAYAHSRGVVHRDVKPQNILLNEHGDALVTDFGLAKIAAAPALTQANTIMGSPPYMSPEQWCGTEITPASDQYSLGIVSYELLAGARPFEGSTESMMLAHVDTPPAPLRAHGADLPAELQDGVLRMLAKSAAERWPDLAHVIEALGLTTLPHSDRCRDALVLAVTKRQWQAPEASSSRSPTPASPARRRPHRARLLANRRWWLASVGGLVAIAAVLLTVALTRGRSEIATVSSAAPLSTVAPAPDSSIALDSTATHRQAPTLLANVRAQIALGRELSRRAEYDSAADALAVATRDLASLAGLTDSTVVVRLTGDLYAASQENRSACAADRAILARRGGAVLERCR